jgi:hypothetical protein
MHYNLNVGLALSVSIDLWFGSRFGFDVSLMDESDFFFAVISNIFATGEVESR